MSDSNNIPMSFKGEQSNIKRTFTYVKSEHMNQHVWLWYMEGNDGIYKL